MNCQAALNEKDGIITRLRSEITSLRLDRDRTEHCRRESVNHKKFHNQLSIEKEISADLQMRVKDLEDTVQQPEESEQAAYDEFEEMKT
jgi:hypothetical protein